MQACPPDPVSGLQTFNHAAKATAILEGVEGSTSDQRGPTLASAGTGHPERPTEPTSLSGIERERVSWDVSAGEIRDFRGTVVARPHKSLFITPGSFTKDAVKEPTRDSVPPIDLLDGESLADKLRELGLGVKVEFVEQITVEPDWFRAI